MTRPSPTERSYKKLYEAQKAEHEKTWALLRAERTISQNLRHELLAVQKRNMQALEFIASIPALFAKVKP